MVFDRHTIKVYLLAYLFYKQESVKYHSHTKESMLPAKLFFKGVEAVKFPALKLLQLKLRWD